jgi:hypothetical protein
MGWTAAYSYSFIVLVLVIVIVLVIAVLTHIFPEVMKLQPGFRQLKGGHGREPIPLP